MRIFIAHAHPEPNSFNGALIRAAQGGAVCGGARVAISDPYAMGFNPVSDRQRQQAEEANAAAHDGFDPAIQAEMDKLFWCDDLFPPAD